MKLTVEALLPPISAVRIEDSSDGDSSSSVARLSCDDPALAFDCARGFDARGFDAERFLAVARDLPLAAVFFFAWHVRARVDDLPLALDLQRLHDDDDAEPDAAAGARHRDRLRTDDSAFFDFGLDRFDPVAATDVDLFLVRDLDAAASAPALLQRRCLHGVDLLLDERDAERRRLRAPDAALHGAAARFRVAVLPPEQAAAFELRLRPSAALTAAFPILAIRPRHFLTPPFARGAVTDRWRVPQRVGARARDTDRRRAQSSAAVRVCDRPRLHGGLADAQRERPELFDAPPRQDLLVLLTIVSFRNPIIQS